MERTVRLEEASPSSRRRRSEGGLPCRHFGNGLISRCGALASCRGFGTGGWVGLGTPDSVQRSYRPPQVRHRSTLHASGIKAACAWPGPTTLADG